MVLTTSRDPSARLQQFAKEFRLLIPGCQRINRGGYVLSDLVDLCRGNDVTDLIILHEHRGVVFRPGVPWSMRVRIRNYLVKVFIYGGSALFICLFRAAGWTGCLPSTTWPNGTFFTLRRRSSPRSTCQTREYV